MMKLVEHYVKLVSQEDWQKIKEIEEIKMKSIICRAYNPDKKKTYWFDVLWGNTAQQGGGYIGMLPIEERERKFSGGGSDNRILVDPNNCNIQLELSPYMPAHLGLGKRDCCGIFDVLNDNGIAKCNECGMNINDAISNLRNQEDCPICHGKGSTTDHHDPCSECGGSGKVG